MASEHHMKRALSAAAAIFLASFSLVFADASVEQVQHALKDQGFYYGEITGQVDTDTTAAIRRFQIRNGLKVTGQLDAPTRKSLGVVGSGATVKPTVAPTAEPRATPPADTSDLREEPAPPPQPQVQGSPHVELPPDYAQPPVAPQPQIEAPPDTATIFAGTPFQGAPPDVQQRLVVSVQILLGRSGYYRSGIDGVFGPDTAAALQTYQANVGLQPTGRLDSHTLSALGLLPGQRRPGVAPPYRRFYRTPPVEIAPDGEPIYRPR
jgi:peptidoglycan hydrolase-like protein with peptidoglycan-binding domain